MRWGLKGRRGARDAGEAADGERSPRPVNDDIRPLMTVQNEPMAHYWADLLGEAGIKTMIRPGGAGIGAWGSAATLEHDILVLASQLDDARRIVEQTPEDGDVSPSGSDAE